jgi:hypothetical protein
MHFKIFVLPLLEVADATEADCPRDPVDNTSYIADYASRLETGSPGAYLCSFDDHWRKGESRSQSPTLWRLGRGIGRPLSATTTAANQTVGMSGTGRGCVKTRPWSNFGGPATLGEVEKIDPGAIWKVAVLSGAALAAFSHGLGRECQFEAFGCSRSAAALCCPGVACRE